MIYHTKDVRLLSLTTCTMYNHIAHTIRVRGGDVRGLRFDEILNRGFVWMHKRAQEADLINPNCTLFGTRV